ncbi:Glycoside hydrolase, family 9 [Corchorus capsularis]|uniref:cellulase n=1 Tax=Corchorus capsularis TaxID=210143 RepID=A0A1R3K264_COCAP|nr:Glycoside hydrolase, family 9 [Corchorus capsularis]OMP01172.1 Glycoside hydrolase, family 9 [Corchorus capsularis]
MTKKRPLTRVNTSVPGADVAVETAAAMASASLVFKTSDSTYSSTLLKHAKQLFTFADKYIGCYISSYEDKFTRAASWLYHAIGDQSYLKYVAGVTEYELVNWGSPTWLSLGERLAITQHPVASAFLASVYSDYMLTSQTGKITCGNDYFKPLDLRKFAKSQADYVLGSNPLKMSFLVGCGDKYQIHASQRGFKIPIDATTGCKDGFKWLYSTDPNPNVAIGVLVAGSFFNETYIDSRNNSMQAANHI